MTTHERKAGRDYDGAAAAAVGRAAAAGGSVGAVTGGLQAIRGSEVVGGAGAAGQGGVVRGAFGEQKHPRGQGGKWTKKAAKDVKVGDYIIGPIGFPTRVRKKQMNRHEWNHVRLYFETGGSTMLHRGLVMDVLNSEDAAAIQSTDHSLPLCEVFATEAGQHDLVKALRAERLARAVEALAVRAGQLGQVNNPEGHNQWTVGDLALKVRVTPSTKEWKRHLNDHAYHVFRMTPEDAHKNLDEATKIWTESLAKVNRIAEGKEEAEGRNLEHLRYHEGRSGKVLSPQEWAEHYALPEHASMIQGLSMAKKALANLQKRHAQEVKERKSEVQACEVRAAQGAFAPGHKFWGNQWSDHAQHPEGDPAGEPSGKIRHAVLVIGGKRYKGPSHFQALMAWKPGTASWSGLPIEKEGFETESGHFLDRKQAADYALETKQREPGYRGALCSEDLHLRAIDGALYTQDAVQAADTSYYDPRNEVLDQHSRIRAEAQARYQRQVNRIVAQLEAEAVANLKRTESAARRKKRREEELEAAALLLFLAGAAIYGQTSRKLALLLAPGTALGEPDIDLGGTIPPQPTTAPLAPPSPDLGPSDAAGATPGEPADRRTRMAAPEPADPEEAAAFASSRKPLLVSFPVEMQDRLEQAGKRAQEAGQTPEQVADVIRRTAEDIEAGQGAVVAQTEAQAAYGSAQMRLLERAGFETVLWDQLDRPTKRETHAANMELGPVKLGYMFPTGQTHPGDPRGGPENCCNCLCILRGIKRKPGTGHLRASEPVQATHISEHQRRTPSGGTTIVHEHEDSRGEHITLYRAADKPDTGFGAHFAELESDAKAYTDNPGFGGGKVHKYSIRMKTPLVLNQSNARDLSELADAVAKHVGGDAHEIVQDWKESGFDSVFGVLENARGVNKLLSQHHDFIKFKDDFPENATTWKQLHSGVHNPSDVSDEARDLKGGGK